MARVQVANGGGVCRWLVVKNWLIHKKRKVELAPKRTWKKYWVCLKGTMLLFYSCDDSSAISDDSVPRHMLGKTLNALAPRWLILCMSFSTDTQFGVQSSKIHFYPFFRSERDRRSRSDI